VRYALSWFLHHVPARCMRLTQRVGVYRSGLLHGGIRSVHQHSPDTSNPIYFQRVGP
jgi:hypothetical protein